MRQISGMTALVLAVALAGAGVAQAQDKSPTPEPSVTPDVSPSPDAPPYAAPPPGAPFDYQIGGDYEPADGVRIVVRDWFEGGAPDELYAICYVNAFQTQADEPGVERPDERSAWPAELVLNELGDDPAWGGEYLIDLSTEGSRAAAAAWVEPMVGTCAEKGFEAVEFDNLDSWTRFRGTPLDEQVPFGRAEAVAYAGVLVGLAHEQGLAAAQKNTPQLPRTVSREGIGFDFAIAEECGRYRECGAYREVFETAVLVVEYRARDQRRTCRIHGDALSVVLRDVLVSRPGSAGYIYRACDPTEARSDGS